MPTHNVKVSIDGGSSPSLAQVSNTYTGTGTGGFESETLVGSGTNGGITQIAATLDVSAVKSFWIKSSIDVTFETNTQGAGADTINLLANKQYDWNTDKYDAFLLGTDVTAFFFTNAAAGTGTISAGWVYDATP
jgi:hypothetical protein